MSDPALPRGPSALRAPRRTLMAPAWLLGVISAGTLAIAASLYTLVTAPVGYEGLVLALLTLASGLATLRMPGFPASFSISDTFTMTAALLLGPAAGTAMVALDGLAISLRLAHRDLSVVKLLYNATAPAIAMWVAAKVFYLSVGVPSLAGHTVPLYSLILAVAAFAALYFLLNTALIAVAVALERRQPVYAIWREHFLNLWLTYFGGGAAAAVLVVFRHVDLMMFAIIGPLPLALYFAFRNAMGRLEDKLGHLDRTNRMYLATIEALTLAVDAKDHVTHGHIRRVQKFAVNLARALGVTDELELRAVEAASLLHDVGKLAVPEHILNKPGTLTPTEFEKMKVHASVGADILASIDFPYPIVPIVRHHHEKWNGSGYPAGLKGTAIPLGARILAVVDCFDAVTSDRPYRPRLPDTEALAILVAGRGTLYDPDVVDKFLKVVQETRREDSAITSSKVLHAITETMHAAGSQPAHWEQMDEAEVLAALFDLGSALAAESNPAALCELLQRDLARLMPASLCVIYCYEAASDRLVAAGVPRNYSEALQGLSMPVGQRLSGWVAANRSTIVNSDATLDLGNVALRLEPTPQCCLSTAIERSGQLLGALAVYSATPQAFDDHHATVVEVLARKLADRLSMAAATAPKGCGTRFPRRA